MTAIVKSGKARLEETSPADFKAIIVDMSTVLENTEEREIFAALCGGLDNLKLLCDPKGVGIGAFAKLVKLPASTVRHYVELGLVSPCLVNGKFRFFMPNYLQVQHVMQWIGLGMTLAQIVDRFEGRGSSSGFVSEIMLGGKLLQSAAVEVRMDKAATSRNANPQLEPSQNVVLADLEAQIVALESKQYEVQARLSAAQDLKLRLTA